MEGDGFQQEFRMELDSLKKYIEKDADTYIIFASYLMKKHQDDYGFETMIKFYTSRDSLVKYRPEEMYLSPFFNSTHKTEVIEALRFIIQASPNRTERVGAFYALRELSDLQIDFYRQIALNDPSVENRYYAADYLKRLKDYSTAIQGYKAVVKAKIDTLRTIEEYGKAIPREIIRTLFETKYCVYAISNLEDINSPYSYKALLELQAELQPGPILDRLLLALETYWPPTPNKHDSATVSQMVDSLVSFIPQCASLGWLGDANFIKELDNHLANAKKHLEKSDTLKCAREVEKFQAKISKEYKEANANNKRFVTIEGWKFLYYNAQYIIDRLVKLPARSTGTILQQIDSLKTELQNQNKQKNIGGAIFVKGLTLLIDKARKELQRSDSTETAMYISLFQLTVDESGELTKELEQKGKKSSAIYVKDEAYIALYYRSKYILEGLPEPKKNIQEQRQQMMKERDFKEMQQEIEQIERESAAMPKEQ
jgi:hypothetical protein